MIPVLYSSTVTQFLNNGLGRLADAVKCHVTEERNGAYELEMTYPVGGRHYNDILISNIIYAKPSDGKPPQPFRIYSITKPIGGIVTVRAEHVSYQLSNIPVKPFFVVDVANAFLGLKSYAAEDCPFTFFTDKTTTGSFEIKVPKSIRSAIGGEEGSILDIYGGELEWDNWTVKLWNERGHDSGVVLRYGKNITDVEQEENIDGVYTGICPYWTGTDGNSHDVVILLPEGVLHSSTTANYPYPRTIPVDFTSVFQSQPTEAQLRIAGQQYIIDNNIGIPKVSIKVSFVPLWQTEEYKNVAPLERVNLCDTITVFFEKLGINAKAKVVKTDYDVLLERYIAIEVGDATTNLADGFRAVAATAKQDFIEATSEFSKEIERATAVLAGVYGGHVVFDRTADGEIYQILIMDAATKEEAINVIRMNQAGIGFSQNGYNGPFNSAWLIDGTLDMGVINVLNMTANLITTGVIRDRTGRNYWNLDTGEISIQATVADIGIGGRNYIRKSNTLDFKGYHFAFDFNYNNEQALLNGTEMEVAVG